ncbi:GNAT family N-acetyltransferase [Deinococcus aquatilis]|jgi:RimJ/RimL family protein N-acetyltransferase|uniref:GNAT family N-acetyltransferase n=1 Tax=Deinococcus aquatilis TaxID=519440 RepID=UPI0003795595|nr:GNAT family protein [Deinococcus aquatilis]
MSDAPVLLSVVSLPAAPAPPAEWLLAPTLPGRFVTLEALTEAHAEALNAGADADTVAMLARGGPEAATVQAWADYITRLNALPNRINWAVLLDGRAVGRISYSEVKTSDRWVEIGTMLLPAARGGVVNPESKLLLLTRAFEVLGANRVHFKVDARNARSLAAMRKLGAVQEGTLRQFQVRPDGFARDSVMFSIVREEWQGVRAGLEARLNASTS